MYKTFIKVGIQRTESDTVRPHVRFSSASVKIHCSVTLVLKCKEVKLGQGTELEKRAVNIEEAELSPTADSDRLYETSRTC